MDALQLPYLEVSLIFYSTGRKTDKISGNDKGSTLWLWTSLTITTLQRLSFLCIYHFWQKYVETIYEGKEKTSRTFSVSGLLTKLEWWWRQRNTTIDPLSRPALRSLHSTPRAFPPVVGATPVLAFLAQTTTDDPLPVSDFYSTPSGWHAWNIVFSIKLHQIWLHYFNSSSEFHVLPVSKTHVLQTHTVRKH
jgi:hypothetical protein